MAGDPFREAVRVIEQESGVHHPGIPFFARILVKPAMLGSGAGGLKLAVFESEGKAFHVDEVHLAQAVEASIGPEWQKFVEVRSRRDKECVLIFAKSGAGGTTMLIVSLESEEATVVEVKVDVEKFGRWISDPTEMSRRQLKHKDVENGGAD